MGCGGVGRHDAPLIALLQGATRLAAEERLPPTAPDDAAEARRLGRVAASVFAAWMQRLTAGLVVAVAEHFDARFRPLRGTLSRGRFFLRTKELLMTHARLPLTS